jgi:sulfonate transport system substrate-binding protein
MTNPFTSLPLRALALAAAFLLSATTSFAAEGAVLRVGAISAADGRPVASGVWGVFDDKGWLKEELAKVGVTVKTIYLTGAGPAVNEAFANDTIDVAMYGDLPAIVGKAGGLDTVWLAGNSVGNESALVVPSSSAATSLADLKGKRIVVHKGRPWELGLSLLLDEQSLKPSDFKIYNLPEGQIPNTVAANAVDAAYVSWSTALTIEKRKVGRVIWSNLDKPAHWKYTSELFATRKFTDQHPEIVQILVNQWVRASAWADQNEEEYTRIGAKSSGSYDIDVKARGGKRVALVTSPTIPEFRIEHYRRSAEFAKKKGYIRSDIDIPSWLNTSFLDKALKEQKLENFWPALDKEGNVPKDIR